MFGICLCIQPQTSASTDSSCATKSRIVLADTSVLSSWVGEHGNRVSSCGCAEGSKESDTTSIASADCTSVPNKFSGIPIKICSFMQLNFNVWCLMPLMDSITIYQLQCHNHEPQTNQNYWAKEPLPSLVLASVLPPTGSCWACWEFLAQQWMQLVREGNVKDII